MQDYPKTLPPTARVGFTVMEPWLAYAPVKNNPEDAARVWKLSTLFPKILFMLFYMLSQISENPC